MNENWREFCPTCKHFIKNKDKNLCEDSQIEYGTCKQSTSVYKYANSHFKYYCKSKHYEYDLTIPPDTSFLKEEPIKGCKRRIFYAIYRFLRKLQRRL